MFLKRLERRKNGKGHTYWALVESYRTAKGSRHRIVAYLGELKKSERSGCEPSLRSNKCSHDFSLESPSAPPPVRI